LQAYSHVREKSYCRIYYILKIPLRPHRRPDLSVIVTNSYARSGRAQFRDSFAERKRTPCIYAHVARYKEHAERRGRIAPTTLGALIRFHPRGKDVALTCNEWYRANLDEGVRSRCCWLLVVPLLSSGSGETKSTPETADTADAPGVRQSALTCP